MLRSSLRMPAGMPGSFFVFNISVFLISFHGKQILLSGSLSFRRPVSGTGLHIIYDTRFFPGCKMLFTQISPLLQCHNLCKFHHRQEISRRTAAFPAPCGMGNGFLYYNSIASGYENGTYLHTCRLERATRIELATSAWEADVLPLNYARIIRTPSNDTKMELET